MSLKLAIHHRVLEYYLRTSMLNACIFPKSITKWGGIFKSMNCAFFFMHMIKYICKSCGNTFLMFQMSSNGEIIKNISTYPKINICSHHICSRLHKSSDPLSLLPHFAIKACRIDFVYSIYFCFSFYCTCASFNHKLIYLYALLEMEKGGAPLFLK